ncbi:MAG: hypothetical protein AM326_01525 [Candidatus Thorarchaeota archaeon SMTZ-45]|nr:MAG: hypothetical protein AM326_01525 [Candidatus Thorarchaeota archaeon SMTZ-45]
MSLFGIKSPPFIQNAVRFAVHLFIVLVLGKVFYLPLLIPAGKVPLLLECPMETMRGVAGRITISPTDRTLRTNTVIGQLATDFARIIFIPRETRHAWWITPTKNSVSHSLPP